MLLGHDIRRSGSEFNSQIVSDFSTESSTKNSFAALSQRQSNLREFTFLELKTATKNFSRSLMIGEGGFSSVYRGVIQSIEDPHNKIDIAVKQLNRRGLQGHKEWVTEVNVLGVVEHQNLATIMKIAQDAARGLAYLHEGMYFQRFQVLKYTFRRALECKAVRLWVGQTGAFRWIKSCLNCAKSDVWSYGVFIYELITGRRPLDQNPPKGEQKLLEWVRSHISDIKKFRLILDPRLEGKYSLKSAHKLAVVANKFLARQAKVHPKMSEVLEMVNRIVEATDMVSP
ncbi:hypothetical protein REPUB_Repub13aG0050800 [Reevesia pubescens]